MQLQNGETPGLSWEFCYLKEGGDACPLKWTVSTLPSFIFMILAMLIFGIPFPHFCSLLFPSFASFKNISLSWAEHLSHFILHPFCF